MKIQFLDTQTGFISIQNYNTFPSTSQYIYRTTNAGADWEMIYEDTNGSYAFGDFCFTSPDDGFVLKNNGKILHTANGGGNWAEIQYGEDIESPGFILFPTADIGYLTSNLPAGNKGRIYRTEDGGLSWEIDFEKDSVFFQKLSFVDGQNGYVVGKYDQVYRRSGTNGTSYHSPMFNMNIFPNPATNYLEIESELPMESYQLIVKNIAGQILHKSNTTNSKTRINVEDFPSGVYFVKWMDIDGKQMGIGKFVKQ